MPVSQSRAVAVNLFFICNFRPALDDVIRRFLDTVRWEQKKETYLSDKNVPKKVKI